MQGLICLIFLIVRDQEVHFFFLEGLICLTQNLRLWGFCLDITNRVVNKSITTLGISALFPSFLLPFKRLAFMMLSILLL